MYKIIGVDQKAYGPITAEQLRFWIKEGRVNANTLAQADGTTDWKPLGSFAEFAEPFGLDPAGSTSIPPLGAAQFAGGRAAALQTVKSPAIALKVTAVIGLIVVVLGLVMNVMSLAGVQFTFGMQQMGDPRIQKMISQLGGGLGIVQNLIGAGIAVAIWMGATKMESLQNYQFAMTASVLAMVPCLSPCCLLGLPFGIWAVVVLSKPEIKSQFT